MPRSNSRSTLKLPAKPGLPSATDGARSPFRKPVRGGSKAPNKSVAQRAGSVTAKAERPAGEVEKKYKAGDKPRAEPRFNRDESRSPAREVAPAPAESAALKKETPQPREMHAPEIPKSYPKRGIARSTGARALPPARAASEGAPRRQTEAFRPAPPLPIPAPRHEAPAAPQADEATAPRRPFSEPPRLSKRISEMAQCSRRMADEWIENGWVRVDGVVVTTLGTRVHPRARVEIREEAGKHQVETVTIVLNKSLDMNGAPSEDGDSVAQLIRPENRWPGDESRLTFKATHLRGLAQAGKLDAEACGMLVFTQEGSVARRIAGDDTRLEKEYMVRVEGELTPAGMKLLNHGLALDDVTLKRAQVSWQNEQQLRFVLHESRKRQIQRMCELVGLRVTGIKRIRIGSVSLGKLPAGQWRYLRDNERF